jgi:hypothetical protein
MKTIIRIIAIACFTFILVKSNAQTVKGAITVGKTSELKIDTKSDNLIDIFIDFRKERYPILFSFQADGTNSKGGKEIIFFEFITEVYYNGKLMGKSSRNPMPYIPGDMIICTEGFDFISLLGFNEKSKATLKETPGKLAPGSYQVKLQAKPIESKGQIQPATFSFTIQ